MKYLLTLLSSGRPTYLERTLASYAQFLTPKPSAIYVYDDGATLPPIMDVPLRAWKGTPSQREGLPQRLGQCAAQAHCWQAAAESDCEWVFHAEDDVVLLRPTDLRDLMTVLEDETESERVHLAQMALVRCPWGSEIEFGGYIPMMPGLYERHEAGYADWQAEWIETTRNWAHAPALFRTDLCRELRFPARRGCETKVGTMIRDKHPDAVFGLWGWGEPWVAHIGVERARGSHGY